MTCRAVHAEQKTITTAGGGGIDPERGVLLVSDQPQLRISQRVRAEGAPGQLPHAGHLLTFRAHGPPSHAGQRHAVLRGRPGRQ
jgi:hypothetical protein